MNQTDLLLIKTQHTLERYYFIKQAESELKYLADEIESEHDFGECPTCDKKATCPTYQKEQYQRANK